MAFHNHIAMYMYMFYMSVYLKSMISGVFHQARLFILGCNLAYTSRKDKQSLDQSERLKPTQNKTPAAAVWDTCLHWDKPGRSPVMDRQTNRAITVDHLSRT